MRRLSLFGLAAVFAAALAAQDFKLGSKVGDFSLKTVNGEAVQFGSLKGPVTVVTFTSVQCPVSNAYNERMNRIYNEYGSKGVKFVFINSNSTEPSAEVGKHAEQHFPFKVYKDEDNLIADRFGASVTPESFVVDRSGTVVYHGSIDDSQEVSRVTQNRLQSALDDVLAGKPVTTSETKAFGCSIKRGKKTS